jgi:hypothetical protein
MHAALVTAYKDFDMLERLVLRLQSLGMRVFVHIDKRSAGAKEAVLRIRSLGAEAYSWYSIHWGSRSHLGALLRMMRIAIDDPDVSYVHTISGQDYPIKSSQAFEAVCDGSIFMDLERLNCMPARYRERFERYHIRDLMDPLFRLPARADEVVVSAQRLLGIRRQRTRSRLNIFKGLVWVSMPADAACYCCNSDSATRLWGELRFTALPEEFYFQTLLLASPFAERIDPDNRRYMDWMPRDGSRPAVLNPIDYPTLESSSALFARKLDSKISAELLEAIDQHLLVSLSRKPTHEDAQRISTLHQAVSQ